MSLLRFRYQTLEFGHTDIHVRTLRDRQEFSDPDSIASDLGISSANWSLFGIIWASGELLARLMYDYDIQNKRILEVGCGIGLASLVLNNCHADITATDYHPEAGHFLDENTQLNHDENIPFVRTSWTDQETSLGKFDIIIGSDLLYEQEHIEALSHFINQHANPHSIIIIVDPGRKHTSRFSQKMKNYGFSCEKEASEKMDELTQPKLGCTNFQTFTFER